MILDFNSYEPKKENRFFLKFPEELGIKNYFVSEFNRPVYNLNNYDVTFDPFKVVLYDPIGPSTTQIVMDLIRKKPIFNCKIEMLDPVGTVVEEWEILNCKITKVDFGVLSYKSNEPVKITLWFEGQPFLNF